MKKSLLCLLLLCLTLCAVSAGAEQLPSGIDLSVDRKLEAYLETFGGESREFLDFYDEFSSSQLYLYHGEFYLDGSLENMYGIENNDLNYFHNLPTWRKGRATVTDAGLEVVFDEIKTVVGLNLDLDGKRLVLDACNYYPASLVQDPTVMEAGPTIPALRMVITPCTSDCYAYDSEEAMDIRFPDISVSDHLHCWANDLPYYKNRGTFFSNTWYPDLTAPKKYQGWSITVDENGLATVHANKKDYPLSIMPYSMQYFAVLPPDALDEGNTLLKYYFDSAKAVNTYPAGGLGLTYTSFYADKKKRDDLAYVEPFCNAEGELIGYKLTAFALPDDVISTYTDELTGSICHTTASGLTLIEADRFAYHLEGSCLRMEGKVGSQKVKISTRYDFSLYSGKDVVKFYPSQVAYAYPDENQRYEKYTVPGGLDVFSDNASHNKALAKWEKATLTMNYEKNTFTLKVGGSKATGPIPWLEVGVYNQKIGGQEFSAYWEQDWESGQWLPVIEVVFSEKDSSYGYGIYFFPAE